MQESIKKRYNIWMISKWYPNREDPQLGVFIQKHARAISKNNYISVLYIHSTIDLFNKIEIEEKVSNDLTEVIVYFRKSISRVGRIINFFRFLNALHNGIGILNKKNPTPNIIHAYILTRPGIFAWYLAWRKKIPFIISEQWSGYLTGKYLMRAPVIKIINRFLVRKAASVTCVSSFLLTRMKECGLKNSKYLVIPNVVENVPQKKNRTEKNQIDVLLVADLVDEIKNISGVIRMISKLEDDIKFTLRIVGSGPDENKLKKLAKSFHLLDRKIFFEGLKDNAEVYDYLHRCDFLIMNSRFETFSLICAEAMSCGKPVLATRCGGPNEFVNATTGVLIEPDNDEELKMEFLKMLAHFRNFDSGQIKNYSIELFSMDKVGAAFQKVYTSIITSG